MADPVQLEGVEFKLTDGSVVKGADVNEALKNAIKMKEDTSAALREEREKRESIEAQIAVMRQQIEDSKPKPVNGGYDKTIYFQLLNEDPIKAANYLDQHRFGLDSPEQVPQRFAEMNSTIEEVRGQMVGASFLASHPEFPQETKAAELLSEKAKELYKQGYPFGTGTVELAYSSLVGEGKIKPVEISDKGQEPEEAPPSLRGTGATGISETEAEKIEQMSDKELEALMRTKGMFK